MILKLKAMAEERRSYDLSGVHQVCKHFFQNFLTIFLLAARAKVWSFQLPTTHK
jgi:hypothetical protein